MFLRSELNIASFRICMDATFFGMSLFQKIFRFQLALDFLNIPGKDENVVFYYQKSSKQERLFQK